MTHSAPAATGVSRRSFLKLSAGSAALLAAGSGVALLSGCSSKAPVAPGYEFLQADDLALFSALAPAVISLGLPAEAAARTAAIERICKGVDATCARIQPAGQKPLRQLFDLLNGGLTRRIAAGVGSAWSEVGVAEANAFLQRWRDSRIGLFNAGYAGLIKLISAAHFSTPEGALQTGYPGPLAWAYAAANAA